MQDVEKAFADALANALALIRDDKVWCADEGDIHIDLADEGGGWLDLGQAARRAVREEYALKYAWLELALNALALAGRITADEQAARTVRVGRREQWPMRLRRLIEVTA
jgi:hypothetical protein